jgi:hypothetical protein
VQPLHAVPLLSMNVCPPAMFPLLLHRCGADRDGDKRGSSSSSSPPVLPSPEGSPNAPRKEADTGSTWDEVTDGEDVN